MPDTAQIETVTAPLKFVVRGSTPVSVPNEPGVLKLHQYEGGHAEHAVRIEFWGDDVEEIRHFSVTDQRSLDLLEHGLLAPAVRELLLTDRVRAKARELAIGAPGIAEIGRAHV